MKLIYLFFLLFPAIISGQFSLEVNAGTAIPQTFFILTPKRSDLVFLHPLPKFGLSGAILVGYRINPKLMIQSGLGYDDLGFYSKNITSGKRNFVLPVVSLPLKALYGLNKSISLQGGLNLSYILLENTNGTLHKFGASVVLGPKFIYHNFVLTVEYLMYLNHMSTSAFLDRDGNQAGNVHAHVQALRLTVGYRFFDK